MCAGTRGDQGFRSSVAGVTDSCEDLMCVLGTALVTSGKAVCFLKSSSFTFENTVTICHVK